MIFFISIQIYSISFCREYNADEKASIFLMSKYRELENLYKIMINDSLLDRPDCEEILLNRNLWTLSEEEFKAEK